MDQYRKSPRALFIDYDGGNFFITICTEGRKHYFGEIRDSKMFLSRIGQFVNEQLEKCSEYNPLLVIPLYVVMPNHIHFIISVNSKDYANRFEQRTPNPSLRGNPNEQRYVPALSRYLTSLKGAVTKFAKHNGIEFGWQKRYHDHLIRGAYDGNKIADYIMNNVGSWPHDCFNV